MWYQFQEELGGPGPGTSCSEEACPEEICESQSPDVQDAQNTWTRDLEPA